jgi:hypothetical protein
MTTNPRRRTFEFRQLVSLVFQVLDVPAQARPEEIPSPLSARLQEPKEPSDILGIPGWLIKTRTATSKDLSGALDEAQEAAEQAGVEHHAVVWKRQGRAAQQSYVLLDLTTFGKILHDLQKDSDSE